MVRDQREQGNILFAAMMLLVVMNLLGVGIIQYSLKESKVANFRSVDSSAFYVAESCIRDSIDWLSSQTRPDSDLFPRLSEGEDLDAWMLEEEQDIVVTKLAGYGYDCTIDELGSKAASGAAAVGEALGNQGGYGGSGNLTPKFYYSIDSNSSGPSSAQKRIISTVSVTY